ncbi:MAG: hypothetical protein WC373_14350 [Smithella sp.]|jgi:hypothetical protein
METNLPAISPRTAIENIQKQFPAEAAALMAVVNNNVLALGIDECFALRDKDGDIKAFKQTCQLSLANGGLVKLPIGGGTVIISAQGYEMWAEKSAAQVIHPAEVNVYGETVAQNPAPLKNKDGEWSGWVVRSVAVRFTPMGIPQVADRTVIFDIENRKNIDFLAKARKFKQAFRILAKGAKSPDESGSWIEYPFDKYSSLWVNAAHEEALDWYSEISQMMKNSLQLAMTHADRNALKHLSGLQKSPGNTDTWNIPVIAWRATSGIIKWDGTAYKNLQNKVSALTSGDRSEFKEIELTSGTDELGTEDIQVVNSGEVDETSPIIQEEKEGAVDVSQTENKPEESKPEPEKPKEVKKAKEEKKAAAPTTGVSAEEAKIMKNLKVMSEQFPAEFAECCKSLNIDAEKYTAKDSARIIQGMNQLLA